MRRIKSFDFNNLNPEELVAGLKETGFAIISNHSISRGDLMAFYKSWEVFFNSPQENKDLFLFSETNQSGYYPMKSEKAKGFDKADLKEFFHYYAGKTPDPTNGTTSWMYRRMNELGEKILYKVEQGLPDEIRMGLTESLSKMVRGSKDTLFRVIHYPAMELAEEGSLRAAPHEDINLITLLPMATADGLQVLHTDGSWIDVGGDPNAIIVNVGDMLQEATRGYLKSTTHRVLNKDMSNPRYSAPLFIHPRSDVVLSSRYTAGSYLKERLIEIGLARPEPKNKVLNHYKIGM